VARCAVNHSVPSTHSRAATPTPEAGKTSVASSVTPAGPTTKHSSSATALPHDRYDIERRQPGFLANSRTPQA